VRSSRRRWRCPGRWSGLLRASRSPGPGRRPPSGRRTAPRAGRSGEKNGSLRWEIRRTRSRVATPVPTR
jgi:hypothetical protein